MGMCSGVLAMRGIFLVLITVGMHFAITGDGGLGVNVFGLELGFGRTTTSMDMATSTASMAMATSTSLSTYPLDDPRCNDTTCAAFLAGYTASQAAESWASQSLYGHWVTEAWCILLGLVTLWFWTQRLAAYSHRQKAQVFLPAIQLSKPDSLTKASITSRNQKTKRHLRRDFRNASL